MQTRGHLQWERAQQSDRTHSRCGEVKLNSSANKAETTQNTRKTPRMSRSKVKGLRTDRSTRIGPLLERSRITGITRRSSPPRKKQGPPRLPRGARPCLSRGSQSTAQARNCTNQSPAQTQENCRPPRRRRAISQHESPHAARRETALARRRLQGGCHQRQKGSKHAHSRRALTQPRGYRRRHHQLLGAKEYLCRSSSQRQTRTECPCTPPPPGSLSRQR